MSSEPADKLSTIVVGGDFCPHYQDLLGRPQTGGVHQFLRLASLLVGSDMTIVNLECPLTSAWSPIPKSGPHLRADPSWAKVIRSAGASVVTLANNHILDMGQQGLMDTFAACEDAGLKTVGAGANLSVATRPLIEKVNGLRIAVLAVAEHEFSTATEAGPGAWPLEPMTNYYQVRDAKLLSDFILVIVHGGNEHYPLPSPRLVRTCRYLVDVGASAVVCHHTHVPSGFEFYRNAPIVYGTGNLFFPRAHPWPAGWETGYLVRLTIRAGSTARPGLELVPYHQCMKDAAFSPMVPDESESLLRRVAELSSIIVDHDRLAQQWQSYCISRRSDYLSVALALSRIERWLLKRGLWPTWRCARGGLPRLLNLLTCDSHRDVAMEVLGRELGKDRHFVGSALAPSIREARALVASDARLSGPDG